MHTLSPSGTAIYENTRNFGYPFHQKDMKMPYQFEGYKEEQSFSVALDLDDSEEYKSKFKPHMEQKVRRKQNNQKAQEHNLPIEAIKAKSY